MRKLGNIKLPIRGLHIITDDDEAAMNFLLDINSDEVVRGIQRLHDKDMEGDMAFETKSLFVVFLYLNKEWNKSPRSKYVVFVAEDNYAMKAALLNKAYKTLNEAEHQKYNNMVAVINRFKLKYDHHL